MPRQSNQSSTKKKNRIHKKQAQLERDYYKQNTKLAKENNTTAHYSFDWAQDVLVPHYSQQPKKEFFKSQFKARLFGFQNEATGIQTNYILGEHELLNKGPNGTLSLVFNSIKQHFDFKVLERYFKTLPNIGKYHHFLFEASNPKVVKVQEFANSPFIEINLWKDKDKIAENIREIRSLIFPILTPDTLKEERQKYLYKNFPTLVGEWFREGICPVPR